MAAPVLCPKSSWLATSLGWQQGGRGPEPGGRVGEPDSRGQRPGAAGSAGLVLEPSPSLQAGQGLELGVGRKVRRPGPGSRQVTLPV